MITYQYHYSHKTKEVVLNFQVGSSPPMKLIMGAEAFIQDLDFMKKDPKLAHFLYEVRKRKDLPIDHKFTPGEEEIVFNAEEWERKMRDEGEDQAR